MSLLPVLLSGAGGGGGGSGSVIGIILNPAVAASTANFIATYANGSSGVGATLTNGLTPLTAARVATTTALTVTYANGASGVGATLTNAGAQAALSIDGVALSVNDRVLVKNQAAAAQNGVYSVTDIGSGSTNWVMTRVTDFDQAAEMLAGSNLSITAGTTNTGTMWILSTTVSVVGTDAVTFVAAAVFTLDGQTPAVGSRVLIKDQTTAAQNGVYTVTVAGSASVLWQLTRATDFNQSAQMTAGTLIEVINGTVNAGTVWELSTTVVTVGSSSVTFISINISTKVDQNGSPIYAADTGAADAAVITLSPAPSAYTTGMVIRFKAVAANATTTPTINVNGLGAKTIVKYVNTAMAANDILTNQFVELVYDGTNFVMWTQLGNKTGSGATVLANTPTLITPVLGAATATSINFGGTSLANYVEGTWTPVFTSSGGGTATYSTQAGSYTRIGNTVHFNCVLVLSGLPNAGNVSITGLPLTSSSTYYGSGGVYATSLNAGVITPLTLTVNTSSTSIVLYTMAAGNASQLTVANCSSTTTLIIAGYYQL